MTALIVAAFATAAAVTAGIAALNLRGRRDASAYRLIVCFMGAGVALMNALNAVNTVLSNRAGVWLIVCVQAVVSPVVVGAVGCMAMAISDRAWRLSSRTVVLLLLEPAAVLVAAVTNPWHHLLFPGIGPTGLNGMLLPVLGPVFGLSIAYMQVVLWGSAIRVLIIRRRATTRGQRRTCERVLGSYVPPLIVAGVIVALPFRVVDLIPIGQALTMIYIQVMLVGSLPRQIPIAHRHVFATIADAVAVVDHDGRIIEVNPAAHALLRRLVPNLPDDLLGVCVRELFDLDLVEAARSERTLVNVRGTGIDLHVVINPLRDHRTQCLGWAVVARDITETNRRRREAEESADRLRRQLDEVEALQSQLAEQATRDALTGLYNRRYLVDSLDRAIADAPPDVVLSLAIVDIDRFKRINDSYGHEAGDLVLVHVAHHLAGAVRPEDIVARYGGEEFVIVFHGAGPELAWSRVDALRERVERSVIEVDGQRLPVTFSAGVAGYIGGLDVKDLLRRADRALYAAKHRGRNRVELAELPPALAEARP